MKTYTIKLFVILFLSWNGILFLNNNIIQNKIDNNFYYENQGIKADLNSPVYWPTADWITSTPEEQGVNSQRLLDMEEYIQNNIRYYLDSLLIIRNGYIIYETYPSPLYDENYMHHLHSATKSFTSTLIGIAIDKGYIEGTDTLILDFFPNRIIENMDSRKQEIRLEHLLTMTAGYQWEDMINYNLMWASGDWVQYVLNLPMIDSPGSRWNYNTGVSHLLSAILEQVTPNGTLAFAEEYLFGPLGITDYNWVLDPQGIPSGGALLHLRSRDMAKLGYLFLNEGKWENQQIVSKKWVIHAGKTSMILPDGYEPYTGYGYQWWVLFWGKIYSARGIYEQNIFIIPDINMVVVTTGNYDFDPTYLLQTYIFPAAGYIILHPCSQLLILILALSLLFFVPFFINNRGFKKKITNSLNIKVIIPS